MFKSVAENLKGFQLSSCKCVLDIGTATGTSLEALGITLLKRRELSGDIVKENYFLCFIITHEYVVVILHQFSEFAMRIKNSK